VGPNFFLKCVETSQNSCFMNTNYKINLLSSYCN
jgi:hypothetical protein